MLEQELNKRRLHSEINVVPYIDVMLVLLIIFMILSPLLIQGVDVDLPQTDTTKMTIENEPLVVSIDKSGEYFLNLGEELLPMPLVELRSKVSLIFDANPEIEIVIKSDRSVPFEKVAQALASIQSVGVQNVGIVTTGYDS
ncbi:MAG: ExbD/TolR family protein [Proteobacteria bacterium]|jgi:biopolymer transport protein TolR|nr:ExbD/TolR family protein [Pseudomonadota bacterium]